AAAQPSPSHSVEQVPMDAGGAQVEFSAPVIDLTSSDSPVLPARNEATSAATPATPPLHRQPLETRSAPASASVTTPISIHLSRSTSNSSSKNGTMKTEHDDDVILVQARLKHRRVVHSVPPIVVVDLSADLPVE